MNNKSEYCCPFCGEGTTAVYHTSSFQNCIIRKRKCLTCGKKHETAEVHLEISRVFMVAMQSVIEGSNIKFRNTQMQ